jgi:hypothetical protein
MRKQTADYFPHFAYKGRTLTVLESKWGCAGYTFWFKLLELLCSSDGHFYDCSKRTNMSYLAITAMTDEDTALEILTLLADMGKIDAPLWKEKQIIWCQSLVDRLSSLYAKRTTSIPKKPLLDGEERQEEQPQELKKQPQEKPKKEVEKKPSKPKKAATPKPPETEKIKYAENVSMTEAEHQKLIDKYGADKTKLFIEKLDNAKGAKGYTYKNDYRAILNWVVGEVEKELQRGDYRRGNEQNFGFNQPAKSATDGFKPSGGFRTDES